MIQMNTACLKYSFWTSSKLLTFRVLSALQQGRCHI